MKVLTRDFGDVEICDNELLEFVKPIYGFEHLKKFALLSDKSVGSEFVWLQSVEDENICFILIDPTVAMPTYNPKLPSDASRLLGDEIIPWCIAIIAKEFKDSTVNLKSPILINPKTKYAAQVVLDEDLPIRKQILSGEESRGA